MKLEHLKQKAIELGFNFAGVTRAEPSPTLEAYHRWIAAGMHGSMGYMARPDRVERRNDLNVILSGVQSLVMVGLDYRPMVDAQALQEPGRGRIASYAWGLDYHDILQPRLESLAEWMRQETGIDSEHRVYVDTGAVLERSHAMQAGLGFTGKNTMLIHPRRGSYFFLGEILTTLPFDEYDTPHQPTMCGSCTRCLTACPTNAFPKPFVLDARRCISALTIEHKGWIPHELRPLIRNWVYGCDVCQDVCPWQRFTLPTTEEAFVPMDVDRVAPKIVELLSMNEAEFKARFARSPIIRIKRDRMVRNACIAAGNWGEESVIPPLERLLHDSAPIVRGHAAWALSQVIGDEARSVLMRMMERETDTEVREELEMLIEEKA
jgi:epoxyqueuosine reductase